MVRTKFAFCKLSARQASLPAKLWTPCATMLAIQNSLQGRQMDSFQGNLWSFASPEQQQHWCAGEDRPAIFKFCCLMCSSHQTKVIATARALVRSNCLTSSLNLWRDNKKMLVLLSNMLSSPSQQSTETEAVKICLSLLTFNVLCC